MERKASIAVIGCGHFAQNQHISNLIRAQKVNVNLCCFCDKNQETLDDLARRFPGIKTETDYKKVLADPEIDGVVIATKPDFHVPLTLDALMAGKHVYVEKPLAETSEDCAKVLEAEKKSGKRVFVGMNRRLAPSYRDAKRILDGNGGMKTAYYRISDAFSMEWGKTGNYLGTRMLNECCHVIDILRYFAGSEVKKVYCFASRLDEENVTIEFENGSCAMMMSTGFAPYETPKERFEAVSDYGVVTVDDFCELHAFGIEGAPETKCYEGHWHVEKEQFHKIYAAREGLKADIAHRKFYAEFMQKMNELDQDSKEYKEMYNYWATRMPLVNYSVDKGWYGAIEHFADFIVNNVPVEAATATDGYRVGKIIEAIIESRDTGKVVELTYDI